MKPRWKIRNAIIRGAEVISAAAQITDQSTPWSTEAETCSPTVSGHAPPSTEVIQETVEARCNIIIKNAAISAATRIFGSKM